MARDKTDKTDKSPDIPCGGGRMMAQTFDGDFFQMIIAAGHAFVAAKNGNPEEDGEPLAAFLRSEAPLGPGERELLAQLVLGDWRQRPGAKPVTASHPKVREAVSRLRELVDKGWKKEAAKVQVSKELKIGRSVVESYERKVIKREKAIELGKSGPSLD